MASLTKLFSRCLSLTSQVLPAGRRLHMAAEGPGWDFITGLGRMAAQLPTEEPAKPRRIAAVHTERLTVNSIIYQAAMEGAESLNLHDDEPLSASDLLLLEHAEAFNVSQPANWCLKGQVSQQYKGHNVSVWTIKDGKVVNRI